MHFAFSCEKCSVIYYFLQNLYVLTLSAVNFICANILQQSCKMASIHPLATTEGAWEVRYEDGFASMGGIVGTIPTMLFLQSSC